MDDTTADDIRALTAKLTALEIALRAVINTHPNKAAIAPVAQLFAEAARANLLTFDWSDVQIQRFESALQSLLPHDPSKS